MLGADDEGRRRLESSIMQIQSRVAGVDWAHSNSMITMLTAELDQIDRGLALTSKPDAQTGCTRRAVLDWLGLVRLTDRASAYIDECLKSTFGMSDLTATRAAVWAANWRNLHGYVPAEIRVEHPEA